MPTEQHFTHEDWSAYAACYDALNHLTPYTDMLDDAARILVHKEGPLLDAGCGTGNLVARLARSGACAMRSTTAVDASPHMLARAKDKCEQHEIRFIQTDLDAPLPFPDGTFASVSCINALYAVRDPSRTLAEFTRVLGQAGLLVIATPRKGYENGLILKAHVGSNKPDEYWMNAHTSPEREETLVREAFAEDALAKSFLSLAAFNRHITRTARFHFFGDGELCELVRAVGLHPALYKTTYAGQCHLVAAIKP